MLCRELGPIIGGTDPANPTIVPGSTVTILGLVKAAEHNDSQAVVFGFDSAKERFTVYKIWDQSELGAAAINLSFGEAKKLNIKAANLVLDNTKPAHPSFAELRCPTLGNEGDLQFGIDIDVTAAHPHKPLIIGAWDAPAGLIGGSGFAPMLADPLARVEGISAVFSEQPSDEKLDSVAFNSGSITFRPNRAFSGMSNSATTMQ
jgi:hypothetical protein